MDTVQIYRDPLTGIIEVKKERPVSRKDPQIKLRVPADLKATLERSAAENNRTLNGELVHRLTQAMDKESRLDRVLAQLEGVIYE